MGELSSSFVDIISDTVVSQGRLCWVSTAMCLRILLCTDNVTVMDFFGAVWEYVMIGSVRVLIGATSCW